MLEANGSLEELACRIPGTCLHVEVAVQTCRVLLQLRVANNVERKVSEPAKVGSGVGVAAGIVSGLGHPTPHVSSLLQFVPLLEV